MTRRMQKELQRVRSKLELSKEWESYLDYHSLRDDRYARIVASALEDTERCHINWFLDAVESIKESRRCNGWVWRKIVKSLQGKGKQLFYYDILSALSIYRRHKKSDYDKILRITKDKETARILSNAELEFQGLPYSRTNRGERRKC